jgi:transposase, IS30 family
MPAVRRMLMLSDREEISRGLAEGLGYKEIALRMGRDPSVISREVARHGGRERYRATVADRVACATRGRPKLFAVERSPRLRAVVCRWLRGGWSPASIAGRLPIDYPDDHACRVSHEAIYQWVYAQPVSTLTRELISLRTGRKARRGGRRPPPAPRIREPRYIDERPADATGRAVPGHWEGDLVIGKNGRSAVATLVERTSRFLILAPLTGRDALTVGDAVIAATDGLPAAIRQSLTWDCGTEMERHAEVTATGLPVYFAHPHSPWERGSNENLNRILREFFPKGIDITSDPEYLAIVACEINGRPRKIHNWKTPSELFAELVETNASTG